MSNYRSGSLDYRVNPKLWYDYIGGEPEVGSVRMSKRGQSPSLTATNQQILPETKGSRNLILGIPFRNTDKNTEKTSESLLEVSLWGGAVIFHYNSQYDLAFKNVLGIFSYI